MLRERDTEPLAELTLRGGDPVGAHAGKDLSGQRGSRSRLTTATACLAVLGQQTNFCSDRITNMLVYFPFRIRRGRSSGKSACWRSMLHKSPWTMKFQVDAGEGAHLTLSTYLPSKWLTCGLSASAMPFGGCYMACPDEVLLRRILLQEVPWFYFLFACNCKIFHHFNCLRYISRVN